MEDMEIDLLNAQRFHYNVNHWLIYHHYVYELLSLDA